MMPRIELARGFTGHFEHYPHVHNVQVMFNFIVDQHSYSRFMPTKV